ncbi:hypothetical protein GN958_ATG02997 [Phytophthora infestans]|uniref:Uncharacterized protein n=1 Tax=Phytophthora infestans TaxID=4787 RepID=A0A8S9V8B4_PHYIN|nr:hypothetical protein GN958_ATG02997 [Phytophthora infestans]
MKSHCRSYGEDYKLATQGVKESFNLNLLSAFCSLLLYKNVADVTDDLFIAEVTILFGKVKNDDLPYIKALFVKELQMDLRETDVDARVLSYFQRYAEIALEHGLDEVFFWR